MNSNDAINELLKQLAINSGLGGGGFWGVIDILNRFFSSNKPQHSKLLLFLHRKINFI